jgi:ribosome-interacting GTPase 1
VPALTRLRGVLVQLVEIPGLIEGAHEDRGGGRALLGVLRGADAMVLCQDASAPLNGLKTVRAELDAAGIAHRAVVAVTKLDEADPSMVERIGAAVGLPAIGVSVLDDESLERLRDELWRLTGLIRVFLRRPGEADAEPAALEPGSTVVDAAATIHHQLAAACLGARVWGSSAKFDGQRVGAGHVLLDDDLVEILS